MAETAAPPRNQTAAILICWLIVGLPLLWGVVQTIIKVATLFK